MLEKSAPFTSCPAAKHPKRSIVGLFILYRTGVGFSSRNNFANLGSFAKVSIPVQSIIPWFNLSNYSELNK